MTLTLIFFISLFGTLLTRFFVEKWGFTPIRATSVLTLAFVCLTSLFHFALIPTLHASFLGASFVGMTETQHMSRRWLLFASLIFSLFFYYLIPYSHGLGGALGCAAFISCIIVLGIRDFVPKKWGGH